MNSEESILSTVSFLSRKYPQACSFSLGRPNPEVYALLDFEHYRQVYKNTLDEMFSHNQKDINEHLCTYGASQGVINGHVSRWLSIDENIHAAENDIFITNGCQEAYNLILLHELREESDCVLIIEPTYFGFNDCVSVLGKSSVTVSVDDVSDEAGAFQFENLTALIAEFKSQGKNTRLLYINPDFNNPMTYRLSESEKATLLAVCHQNGVKIIEDSTYSGFYFDGERGHSIKSQDPHGLVYYVGSFSKVMCPSLRLGYLILNQSDAATRADILHIKDHTSLSTSALNQQIVAGFLIHYGYSVEAWVRPIREEYQRRRNAMVEVLQSELDGSPIKWQPPQGGFFVFLKLPFSITSKDLIHCVENYQVTFMPVSYFSRREGKVINGIRLAFSYYEPEIIEQGTREFCKFLKEGFL
jgi:(S)-3,5-dihydroxyphenylglycine transaminase